MKPKLHLVELPIGTGIFQQLKWEEALLRTDNRNWCLFNKGSPLSIVMGISGQISLLVNQEKLALSPVPLIRRFSGGGTVVVDENTLFVTLICQKDALPIMPYPRQIMEWTAERLYSPLFQGYPFRLKENDYVLGERKWGGNAQSITKSRWLHHSSLLWDFRADHMDYLLPPLKSPAYRQGRSHVDFLCRLSDMWKSPVNFFEELTLQLRHSFEVVLGDKEELEQAAALTHRQELVLFETINDQ